MIQMQMTQHLLQSQLLELEQRTNSNSGTVGSALTGTYGTLTLNSNGSYTYVADQSAADDLDAGDTATTSSPIQFLMELQVIQQR